jgi:hypothetical protein
MALKSERAMRVGNGSFEVSVGVVLGAMQAYGRTAGRCSPQGSTNDYTRGA